MYQGIYVAPLQIKANKSAISKDLNLFACRWSGGMIIAAAETEDKALIMACSRTNVIPDDFQVSKLPNASARGEQRILYMEVHDETKSEDNE